MVDLINLAELSEKLDQVANRREVLTSGALMFEDYCAYVHAQAAIAQAQAARRQAEALEGLLNCKDMEIRLLHG